MTSFDGKHRVVWLALAALGSLLSGCSCGESHSLADAAALPDAPGLDAPGLDALGLDAPGLDAPGLDAPGLDSPPPALDASGVCETHHLVEIPIGELRRLDPQTPHASRSFRVQADYTMSDGCHSRAMPRVIVDPTARTVEVTVRDWVVDRGACAEIARLDTRTITLGPLAAGEWTIRDASAGGTASLVVTVDPPIRAPCVTDGGDCLQDCDCLEGDRCLGGFGLGGPFLGCASACEEDLDCASFSMPGGRCITVEDGLELTCERGVAACDAARPCPEGYGCEAGVCRASFELSSATRVSCTCDSECEPGLSCVRGAGGSRCEVTCPTGSAAWCSGAHWCAEAEQDVAGLAADDAVCGWVGE